MTHRSVLPIQVILTHANASPKDLSSTLSHSNSMANPGQSESGPSGLSSLPSSPSTLETISAVFTSFPGVGRCSQLRTYDEGNADWIYHLCPIGLRESPSERSRKWSSTESDCSETQVSGTFRLPFERLGSHNGEPNYSPRNRC